VSGKGQENRQSIMALAWHAFGSALCSAHPPQGSSVLHPNLTHDVRGVLYFTNRTRTTTSPTYDLCRYRIGDL